MKSIKISDGLHNILKGRKGGKSFHQYVRSLVEEGGNSTSGKVERLEGRNGGNGGISTREAETLLSSLVLSIKSFGDVLVEKGILEKDFTELFSAIYCPHCGDGELVYDEDDDANSFVKCNKEGCGFSLTWW